MLSKKLIAAALAAASIAVPSLASAQAYIPPQQVDTQRIENIANEIQHDRWQLQQAEQNRDWDAVHRLRNQIQFREQRLQMVVSRSCR